MENFWNQMQHYNYSEFWEPGLIILGSLVIGIVVRRFVFTRLIRLTLKTSWTMDDLVISAVKGYVVVWFLLLGLYQAMPLLPLKPYYMDMLSKMLLVILLLTITIVIARIAKGAIGENFRSADSTIPASTSILSNLSSIIVYSVGIMIILQRLGISITPIITALGVGGLAVALALQDTLSNLFAGIQILLTKQIRPGDFIQLDTGDEGFIHDITLRNTTIRQLGNNMIIIPNSKLADAIVRNYYLRDTEMSVLVPVGVSYDSDLEVVERVTIEVAKQTIMALDGTVHDFEPFIRYNEFADSSINFNVILRVTEVTNQYILKHEFIKNLKKRYDQEGIEIPFPIRTVYMKNSDKPTG